MTYARALFIGVIALPACKDPLPCGAVVDDDIRTLVEVSWSSDEPGASWVEYGTVAHDRRTPTISDGGTEHSAGLLGLRALEDVRYRAITDDVVQCEGTISTGNLPSGAAEIDVLVWEPERASSEEWLYAGIVGDDAGAAVFDREGHLVWWKAAEPDRFWLDVQPVAGSSRIVHNVVDNDATEDIGRLTEVDLQTGEQVGTWRTVGAHHMFAQIDEGFAYSAVDIRYWSDPDLSALVPVVGDAVVEVGRDGTAQTISNTWDWLPVEKNSRWDGRFYPDAFDWTHMNAIKWQPEAGTYLVSLGNPGLIVEIDRATGLPIRSFGELGTLRPADGEMRWDHPHDPSLTPEGNLLLFLNDADSGYSGGVEYAIGEDGRMREVWRAGFTSKTPALGQVRRLANGNTLLSTGANGLLTEYTPEGDVVWQASTPSGRWFGQLQLVNDLYEGQ